MTNTHPYLPPDLPRSPKRQIRSDPAPGGLSRYSDPERLTVETMQNMGPTAYPALATRHPRSCCHVGKSSIGSAHGMTVFQGRIYHVEGGTLFEIAPNGTERAICSVSEDKKTFVRFGDRLLILPDKLCLTPDSGDIVSLEIHTGVIPGARFQYEGAYLPEGMTWEALGFRAGDAITVEEMDGDTVIATDIYRIYALLGRQGVFEGCPKTTRNGSFRFSRRIPDGTCFCALADGKRLAACVGDTVYLCEENNPFNWQCAVQGRPEVGAVSLRAAFGGDFTACTVWQRQVILFGESAVCRLTGYDAETFALTEQCGVAGIPHSMRDSLCECDGALYYCTHAGVFRYDGARPALVSVLPHELTDIAQACGGSDLLHYHLAVRESNYDVWHFVYTPAHNAWYLEDSVNIEAMAYEDGFLYMQDAYAYVWAVSSTGRRRAGSRAEEALRGQIQSSVIFRSERPCDPRGFRLHCLLLRVSSDDESGSLNVRVQLDQGDGQYVKTIDVATVSGWMSDRLLQIPIPVTRCFGYRILLFMQGRWTIHSVAREIEVGEQ